MKNKLLKSKPVTMIKMLAVAIIVMLNASFVKADTHTTIASGNLNAGATWDNGAPTAGDALVITSGFNVTVSANTVSLLSITIDAGGTLTVSPNFTVTTTGGTTVNGTYINSSTGAISGGMTVGATGTYRHNVNGVNVPTITFDASSNCEITGVTTTALNLGTNAYGNLILNSTLTANNTIANSVYTIKGNLQVISSGTFYWQLGTTPIAVTKDFILDGGTFTMGGSTARTINVSGNLIIDGGTFEMNNLNNGTANQTCNVTGDVTISSGSLISSISASATGIGTLNANGNFSLSGTGTVNFSSGTGSQTSVINLKGNYTQTGGTITVTSTGAGKGSFNFNGTTTQTFSKSGGTISCGGTAASTITFTINNGAIVDFGTSIIDDNGSSGTKVRFTISNNGTMGIGDANGITTSGSNGNIQVAGTRTYTSGAKYIYNGGSAQVTGNGLTQNTPATVTISNTSGDVALSASTTISGALTVDASCVLDAAGYTLSAGSYTNSGTLKFSGATNGLAISSGTVNYYGAGQTVTAGTYENLILSGSGAVTTTGITVNGLFSLEGSTTVTDLPSYGLNSTIQYKGSVAQITGIELPATFDGTGGVIIDNGNGVMLNSSAVITNALLINNGNFVVKPLINLTVNGSTTNNGGMILQSDATGSASFIDNGITASTGAYTVQKYLTGSNTGGVPDGNYWYIGSANDASLSSVFDAAGNSKLWSHNEVTGDYTEITDNATALNVKQGYVARLENTATLSFASTTINTGNQSISLTRNESSNFAGYNLICNPYPSAVNIESCVASPELATTIWYRSGAAFPTYNWSLHSGTGSVEIPALQGFWVKINPTYTSGTLDMSHASRIHSTQAFYKTEAQPNIFRMNVSNGTATDDIVIGFSQGAAEFFENFDSEKMFSTDNSIPQLYSLTSDNVKVVINGYPELNSVERIVNLGFKTNSAGSFTFNATNLTDFDANTSVYLEDTQLGTMQDLRQSASYTFSSAVVDDVNRFKLHFGNMTTAIPTVSETSTSVFAANNVVYVTTPKVASIEVYDLLGNLVTSLQSVQGLNKLQLNAETGIYIVKVQTGTQVTTQKVMISK
jgi:hypothetical protein